MMASRRQAQSTVGTQETIQLRKLELRREIDLEVRGISGCHGGEEGALELLPVFAGMDQSQMDESLWEAQWSDEVDYHPFAKPIALD